MSRPTTRGATQRHAGRSMDILAAFTRYVAQHGYAGANFSEIANELGISKGTIVHHYGTKDRLLAAMHDLYMERRLAEAHQLLEKFDDPAERLAGLLFSFLLYQVVDRDSTVAFQREAATLATHDALIRGRQLRAAYLELVRGVLSDGIERGVFRPLDVQVQSLLIFGSSQWAWTWFHPDGDLTALDVGSSFVQLVLGGLLQDRSALDLLANPGGPIASAVESILHEARESLED